MIPQSSSHLSVQRSRHVRNSIPFWYSTRTHPLDVILITMSVLFACSVMNVAGGMDHMIHVASWILHSNPKYINIPAPVIAFTLTVFSGTGFTTIAILNGPQK